MDILSAVFDEVTTAKEKFPWWPTDPVHAASIVSEESRELVRACNEFTYENGDKNAIWKECIQTAAMAIRFLVNFDNLEERPSK